MIKEEIINAAIELVDYGTGQHNADSPIECFKKGAEFMHKHWQEKTRWIPVEERLPVFAGNRRTILVKTENNLYTFLWVMQEVSLSDFEYYKYWKEID